MRGVLPIKNYPLLIICIVFLGSGIVKSAVLTGTVNDYLGNEISGANIKILYEGEAVSEVNADSRGLYNLSPIELRDYDFEISKQGYIKEKGTLSITKEMSVVNFILFSNEVKRRMVCNFEEWISIDVYAASTNGCSGSFALAKKEKKSGLSSGMLYYDFSGSGNQFQGRWVGYVFPDLLSFRDISKGSKIGMWVKAKGEPYRLYIVVTDRNNRKHPITRTRNGKFTLGKSNAEWEFVVFDLPNEGMEYPVRLDNITIDKVGESANSKTIGAFYIDDIMIISESE